MANSVSPGPNALSIKTSLTSRLPGLTSAFVWATRREILPTHKQDVQKGTFEDQCQAIDTKPESNLDPIHKFLLVCTPFMRWAIKAYQPDVCRIHSDRDFFKLLHTIYKGRNRNVGWKLLMKVSTINFVKVCLPVFLHKRKVGFYL